MKQITVQVAESTQTGNEVLGTKDKKMYYLVLGEGTEKVTLNVGEKTYTGVKKLLENKNKK